MTRVAYSGEAPEPKADALGVAELALANARAESFAEIQASAAKLAPNQVAALIASGGGARRGGRGSQAHAVGGGTIPRIPEAQVAALTKLTSQVMPPPPAVNTARAAVAAGTLSR